MKVFVFDTETTGLPPSRHSPSMATIHKWPYVVQLSFMVYDTVTNKIVFEHDYIISLPDGVEIPEETTKIHGITNGISKNRGINIESALEIMNLCVSQCQCIVAHNIDFDLSMIDVECKRTGQANPFTSEKIYYCTMHKSKELCNLVRQYHQPKPDGTTYVGMFVKKPTLKELHQHLFKQTPIGLHDSMIDVRVCMRCFLKIVFDITLDFTAKEVGFEK